jgi:ABC-type branched-subunit amino acid transport system ATPase component
MAWRVSCHAGPRRSNRIQRIRGTSRFVRHAGADARVNAGVVLLVERNAAMVPGLGSRGYLLKTGRRVAEGKTREVTANHRVPKASLGIRRRTER